MKKQLKKLLEENKGNITEAVITEALDYHTPKDFFTDLLQNGCQSWMVWSLIYYVDTHKFYDKHYEEIEDIRYELQEQWIVTTDIQSDLKNYYAWLSFEHRAYEVYISFEQNNF